MSLHRLSPEQPSRGAGEQQGYIDLGRAASPIQAGADTANGGATRELDVGAEVEEPSRRRRRVTPSEPELEAQPELGELETAWTERGIPMVAREGSGEIAEASTHREPDSLRENAQGDDPPRGRA